MTIQNQTNQGRVDKIVDTVTLIKKSATSNEASTDDIWELMEPALDAMADLCQAEASTPPSPSPTSSQSNLWSDIREMVATLDPDQLTLTVSLCMARIDEIIFDKKTKS